MIDETADRIIDDLLEAAAGFRRAGHFVYESGDHGDCWLALELLMLDARRLERAARALAERLRGFRPEVV